MPAVNLLIRAVPAFGALACRVWISKPWGTRRLHLLALLVSVRLRMLC